MNLTPDYVFTNILNPVTAVCFGNQNSQDVLIGGDEKGTIIVWSLVEFKKIKTIKDAHSSRIIKLWSEYSCWNTKDEVMDVSFISQARDSIKIWNQNFSKDGDISLTIFRTLPSSTIAMCGFSVLLKQNDNDLCPSVVTIASISPNIEGSICLFQTEANERVEINPNSNRSGIVMAIKIFYSDDRIFLLAGYESGAIILWQVEEIKSSEDTRKSFKPSLESSIKPFEDMITCLDYDSLLDKGVCGSVEDRIKIFKIKLSTSEIRLDIVKEVIITNSGLSCLQIRQDSLIIASGGWDSRIRIFSWKSLKPLVVIDYHQMGINSLGFSKKLSSNSKFLLAVSSSDKAISLWSPYN